MSRIEGLEIGLDLATLGGLVHTGANIVSASVLESHSFSWADSGPADSTSSGTTIVGLCVYTNGVTCSSVNGSANIAVSALGVVTGSVQVFSQQSRSSEGGTPGSGLTVTMIRVSLSTVLGQLLSVDIGVADSFVGSTEPQVAATPTPAAPTATPAAPTQPPSTQIPPTSTPVVPGAPTQPPAATPTPSAPTQVPPQPGTPFDPFEPLPTSTPAGAAPPPAGPEVHTGATPTPTARPGAKPTPSFIPKPPATGSGPGPGSGGTSNLLLTVGLIAIGAAGAGWSIKRR
jgi:hypothetical protein